MVKVISVNLQQIIKIFHLPSNSTPFGVFEFAILEDGKVYTNGSCIHKFDVTDDFLLKFCEILKDQEK